MTEILKRIEADAIEKYPTNENMSDTHWAVVLAERKGYITAATIYAEKCEKLAEALRETNSKLAYLKVTSLEDVDKAMFQEMIDNNLQTLTDYEGINK